MSTRRTLCGLGTLMFFIGLTSAIRADDWPQWFGPKRDGVWRETGIVEQFPKEGPKVRWRVPVGMGYSGPAVAGGRVFVTDRQLLSGAKNPTNPFAKDKVEGNERVLCLDEATGNQIWKYEHDCLYQVSYPAGPRTTPVVHEGKVYTLGAMGHLLCLDAAKGELVWSKNLLTDKEYEAKLQMWGFSSNPLIEGDKLICLVGGSNCAVVAFHKDTGKEVWRALSTAGVGYCPPIVITAGGKRQLIVWHSEAVESLDPESGKVYWTQKFSSRAAMAIPTPRQDGDKLFFSCFYDGSLMMKLDADKPNATVAWKIKGRDIDPDKTLALHCVMSTPYLKDGYIYGVCSHGEMRCLKADTGERIWSTYQPVTAGKPVRWANAFIIPNGDRFFISNEQGDLIIARLSPEGYKEISRVHILEPTNLMAGFGIGRPLPVVWSHPAFANKCMIARNDKEIVSVSLAAE